ncbi:DNA repair protein RecN [Pseudoflavitalea sp. G-6-1-2]|uniref:DNA repair protein RecN n=1 Tax=Pseudoflavitalea sp. G-6-1-2 TaxID=2728841 RepID=UPI00146D18FD|nr:DNA repair protein RecN [Pseudoflavitalea sp. G-6-1-2]NML20664.1 DNA repair protein RecN [Pseudoflavitalea sp. G-6-1-2]
MLKRLHIQNYAIIDELEIAFNAKLNIITGETGAGKSILMGALSLILGDRADPSVLLNKEKKCVVEGVFATEGRKVIKQFIKEHDLDAEDELVIRREIAANGKSRAFVNDTPVNLEQLRQLSNVLVDLHRQFDTLELGESVFQRDVLDAMAGNAELLQQYRAIFQQWQHTRHELAELQQQKDQFTKEFDYNKFLFDELQEAGFRENELEESEATLKLLSNSEGIKNTLNKVSFELSEGDQPMVQQLKQLCNQLNAFADIHADIPSLLQRLQSAQIELQDIADEIETLNDRVNFDPQQLEQLNERISIGYKLLKKHGVKTTADLIQIRDNLDNKLQAVLNIDDAIAGKERAALKLQEDATALASKLSAQRQKQVKPLQDTVNKLLGQVGMPNARLQADIQPYAQLQEHGADNIEFLFDANKSNRFEPIRKVASGGELSRLMLCIKSLVAQSLDLATLIFDEIDTGISGEAAKQVGIIMKDLAKKRQVISITHQPQIAGKADAHYFVYKEIRGEQIKTNIRELSKEERITAIAQMLSGEKPTAAALENAREMVMN